MSIFASFHTALEFVCCQSKEAPEDAVSAPGCQPPSPVSPVTQQRSFEAEAPDSSHGSSEADVTTETCSSAERCIFAPAATKAELAASISGEKREKRRSVRFSLPHEELPPLACRLPDTCDAGAEVGSAGISSEDSAESAMPSSASVASSERDSESTAAARPPDPAVGDIAAADAPSTKADEGDLDGDPEQVHEHVLDSCTSTATGRSASDVLPRSAKTEEEAEKEEEPMLRSEETAADGPLPAAERQQSASSLAAARSDQDSCSQVASSPSRCKYGLNDPELTGAEFRDPEDEVLAADVDEDCTTCGGDADEQWSDLAQGGATSSRGGSWRTSLSRGSHIEEESEEGQRQEAVEDLPEGGSSCHEVLSEDFEVSELSKSSSSSSAGSSGADRSARAEVCTSEHDAGTTDRSLERCIRTDEKHEGDSARESSRPDLACGAEQNMQGRRDAPPRAAAAAASELIGAACRRLLCRLALLELHRASSPPDIASPHVSAAAEPEPDKRSAPAQATEQAFADRRRRSSLRSEPEERPTLVVKVVGARGLRSTPTIGTAQKRGKPQPVRFARVSLGSTVFETKTTTVCQSPTWDECLEMPHCPGTNLTVTVVQRSSADDDEQEVNLGSAWLSCARFEDEGFTGELRLKNSATKTASAFVDMQISHAERKQVCYDCAETWRVVDAAVPLFRAPDVNKEPTGVELKPREHFFASSIVEVPAGQRFLQLSDGRGWAPCRNLRDGTAALELADDDTEVAPGSREIIAETSPLGHSSDIDRLADDRGSELQRPPGLSIVAMQTLSDGYFRIIRSCPVIHDSGQTRYVNFGVKTTHSATISLLGAGMKLSPESSCAKVTEMHADCYEFTFGAWQNSTCVIRRHLRKTMASSSSRTTNEVHVSASTCCPGEYRDFWISVCLESGRVAAGYGYDIECSTLLEMTDDAPFVPTSVALMSSRQSSAEWRVLALTR
eukprot:TRINITY_DN29780_c0_g1_i1.p1 TRINITY_DN29780_c0_g1~~TRINITY_DN29780_c0_g1_i1.p1  ORF type:complete len:959 (-),score=245.74 TRINITY_DN29780_c0_g1_i1:173-3049(-)